jgi:hypothetical protein
VVFHFGAGAAHASTRRKARTCFFSDELQINWLSRGRGVFQFDRAIISGLLMTICWLTKVVSVFLSNGQASCKAPKILLEFCCGTFFTYPQHPEAP